MLTKKTRSALILLLTLYLSSPQAMWAKSSDQALIDQSTLIIKATLIDQVESQFQNKTIRLGVLEIHQVLKGSANQALITLQLPNLLSPINSTDIRYKIGTSGLWLLTLNKNGLLSANHPQRFMPMKQAKSILKRLKN